jgi:hypothetical protein
VTDAYRQKLLNWFTSMLIVLLISIIPILYFWFVRLPERMSYIRGVSEFVFPLEESLSWYATVFVPLLIWHVGDFTHKYRYSSSLANLVNGYKPLAGLLCALGLSVMLITSGFLDDLGCPELDLPEGVYQFDGCGSWTPNWKIWLTTGIWLAICLLALWKVAASVFSHTRNIK